MMKTIDDGVKVTPTFGVIVVAAITHQFRSDCQSAFLTVYDFQNNKQEEQFRQPKI